MSFLHTRRCRHSAGVLQFALNVSFKTTKITED